MYGVGTKGKVLFQQQWQGSLSEYITAVAWSPNGIFAASSAAGEVVLWQDGNLEHRFSIHKFLVGQDKGEGEDTGEGEGAREFSTLSTLSTLSSLSLFFHNFWD